MRDIEIRVFDSNIQDNYHGQTKVALLCNADKQADPSFPARILSDRPEESRSTVRLRNRACHMIGAARSGARKRFVLTPDDVDVRFRQRDVN